MTPRSPLLLVLTLILACGCTRGNHPGPPSRYPSGGSPADGGVSPGSMDGTLDADRGGRADRASAPAALCERENGGCDENADCAVREGRVECSCREGYEGDGSSCFDIDECLVENGGCGDERYFVCENRAHMPPHCRPYLLEDLWAGRAHFELDEAQGQIAWDGFHFLSTQWSDGVLHAYTVQNYLQGAQPRSAVALATSLDGVTFEDQGIVVDVGGAPQWRFGAVDSPYHNIGRADEDGWSVNVDDDIPEHLIFGPYVVLPPGPMTVSFELMVDVAGIDDDLIVTIDVFDATSQEVLTSRTLRRDEFSADFEYMSFALSYEQRPEHQMEFRVFWHQKSYVRLRDRLVSQGSGPFIDERIASFPGVLKRGDIWYLVYTCAGLERDALSAICLSTSRDGRHWTKSTANPILSPEPLGWERGGIGTPSLWVRDGLWYLLYHGDDRAARQLGLASGPALTELRRHPENPLFETQHLSWESGAVGKRSILREGLWYYMVYEGATQRVFNADSDDPACAAERSPDNPACVDFEGADWSTGIARSTNLVNWTRSPANPILPVSQGRSGYNSAELVRAPDGRLHLYYRVPGPEDKTERATLRRSP